MDDDNDSRPEGVLPQPEEDVSVSDMVMVATEICKTVNNLPIPLIEAALLCSFAQVSGFVEQLPRDNFRMMRVQVFIGKSMIKMLEAFKEVEEMSDADIHLQASWTGKGKPS